MATITCPSCSGRGSVPLPDTLQSLLSLLRRGESSAIDLAARTTDEVSATAINNRLEDLRRYGFVTRRKSGRRWLYSVPSKAR